MLLRNNLDKNNQNNNDKPEERSVVVFHLSDVDKMLQDFEIKYEEIDEEKGAIQLSSAREGIVQDELYEVKEDRENSYEEASRILALKEQIWKMPNPTPIQILELFIQKNAKMDIRAKWPGVGCGAIGAFNLALGKAFGQVILFGFGGGCLGLSALLLTGGKLYNLYKTHTLCKQNYMSSFLPNLIEMPQDEIQNLHFEITKEDTVDDVLEKAKKSRRDQLVPMGKTIINALNQFGMYRDPKRIILEYAFKDQSIANELCPTEKVEESRCTIM